MYITIVDEVNKYDLPKEIHYKYYRAIIPQRKFPKKLPENKQKIFFPYIKKPKDLNKIEKQCIANYFEIGLKEAEMYIRLLDEDQIKQIIDLYTYGKGAIANV